MKESVWDYPRPPRLEPTARRLRVVFGGVEIASTTGAYRMLETSHPPVYYIPPADVRLEYLEPVDGRQSFCEFKGSARYWTVRVNEHVSPSAAWTYPRPAAGYAAIADYFAFYAGRLEACFVDGELVTPQPGNFYGGWITADLEGPFKGGPGTLGW
jgi:uncharacterized protein (DUF427 family)